MRRLFGIAVGLALLGAVPAQAQAAQEVVVTGLDTLTWDKPVVDINPGDSVRWTFGGTTQVHNVKSTSPNWEIDSPLGAIPSVDSAPYTFTAVGEYTFVCEVHSSMTGSVRVAEGPSPAAARGAAEPAGRSPTTSRRRSPRRPRSRSTRPSQGSRSCRSSAARLARG